MFDISFSEILVIAAVALIVLGPERLPKVARTLGHLLGRAQRYANDVKNDIQREMELEELRKWQNSVEGAARSVETTVRTELNQFQEAIQAEPKHPADEALEPPHETTAEPAPAAQPPATPVQPTTPPLQPKSGSAQP
ncbi:Sec-independent protein translocase TatB [Nitrosospira sp. Nsp14]|uniref:Sec-independent protein translocase protein TatB n=1 Tax=Nitrosospira sp. Nsp14 TaxID=1855333 RepID=UPI0008E68C98|nr:Sec-independent protein translocase protein TatB [Nitrosospira sp. Nsp14]SFH36415.1 Sec-independent protein translocase TatB [Nitrosospira sp. Nsp14]